MLVTQLWISHMKFELMKLLADGTLSLLKDGNIDYATFLAGAVGRPQMQIDEIFGVVRICETMLPSRKDDAEPEAKGLMTTQEMVESMVDNSMWMARRYQDSMVGQLDLSIVNGNVVDPSQEDETRNLLREMASRVFLNNDEHQEPNSA